MKLLSNSCMFGRKLHWAKSHSVCNIALLSEICRAGEDVQISGSSEKLLLQVQDTNIYKPSSNSLYKHLQMHLSYDLLSSLSFQTHYQKSWKANAWEVLPCSWESGLCFAAHAFCSTNLGGWVLDPSWSRPEQPWNVMKHPACRLETIPIRLGNIQHVWSNLLICLVLTLTFLPFCHSKTYGRDAS